MTPIAILVVAQNIQEATRHRFRECLRKSNPSVPYEICMMTSNSGEHYQTFNKCKLLNKGIRGLTKTHDIIVQCDIDMVIPPGLLDKSHEYVTSMPCCFYNFVYKIDPTSLPRLPEEYDKIDWDWVKTQRPIAAAGSWNCMESEYWILSGGYNEYMTEWGWEDDEFRRRCSRRTPKEFKFFNYNRFPLIHVNHPRRTKYHQRENIRADRRARREGKEDWL